MAVVLVGFLVIGLALPVLPLHVHQGLGLGTFAVGLVTGSQFAASLVSRFWSGHYADSRGAKRAVVAGLLAAAASGLLYLLSLAFVATPATSVAVLLLGRGLLGAAESFIITGAVSWGLALVDPRDTGKVIAWVGTAMFAAMALGAPAGTALYARYGFAAIALATTLAPLATLLSVLPLRPVAPLHRGRPALLRVLGTVWVPGLGAAFGSVGFGAIIAFGSLLFAERGWSPVWLVFSAFAAALIVARVLCGHLPDKLGRRSGGARLRAGRGGGPGADRAGARPGPRRGRGGARRRWLLAALPRPRRRGGPPRAAGEPRPRHGRLHGLPRPGAGRRRPRRWDWSRAGRAWAPCSSPARWSCSAPPSSRRGCCGRRHSPDHRRSTHPPLGHGWAVRCGQHLVW